MPLRTPAIARWLVLVSSLLPAALPPARADGPEVGAPVQVRLVHPERQAAAVLRLFEGSRVGHPAAALAAWKRASREPDRLGKPLEAAIASFNPETAPEWGVLHEARLRLALDPDTGAGRWVLAVPNDDGPLAAALTALRLSGAPGPAEAPQGTVVVERLGSSGAAAAARDGRGVVVASSRDVLERALAIPEDHKVSALDRPPDGIDSGLLFRIEPGRMTAPANGPTALRRAIELARGLGCREVEGSLGLRDDRLILEWSTRLDPAHPMARAEAQAPGLDARWLRWVPASRVAALLCLRAGRGPSFLDALFDLADRVDRADPARARLAPLRARVNLPAVAVGAQLEADLWPHLRGITLALLADAEGRGTVGGLLLVLHMGDEAAARRVREDVLPRLSVLWGARRDRGAADGARRGLGTLAGRPLEAVPSGPDVLLGWGEGVMAAGLRSAEHPDESAAGPLAAEWARDGGGCPHRLGAFWPGRVRLPVQGLDEPSPLSRSLAQGPPIVWTGWSRAGHARDRIAWPGLRDLVRRFLDAIPMAPEGMAP